MEEDLYGLLCAESENLMRGKPCGAMTDTGTGNLRGLKRSSALCGIIES